MPPPSIDADDSLIDYFLIWKVNILLAEGIRPWLPAEKYMDKEACENELKQVVGDTDSAHQLDENQILVVGKIGLLIAGANPNPNPNPNPNWRSPYSRGGCQNT